MKKIEIIEKIKTKIKNFLKDDFNNWYVRLCCLCFSLVFIIMPIILFGDLIYIGIKHVDFINEHMGRWIFVNVVVLIMSVLSLLMSKWTHKMYSKIKTYLPDVQSK
jgi:hypothetical protein